MRKNLLKVMKTIVLSVLALSIVAVGSFASSTGANASEAAIAGTEESGVIYVEYSDIDYDTYFGICAPEYTGVDADGVGYVFGGWYAKKDQVYDAIQDTSALASAQADTTSTIVAKFVPAQVLSVKCQNWAGTNVDSDKVIVRVLSSTDSKNYRNYGFVISKIVNGVETALGTFESEDGDEVYSSFNYYESQEDTTPEVYKPFDLFGNTAQHFTTCTVGYIPKEAHGTIICIKPFWKTLDGTTVYGLSKFAHVEDGYLGYVNVPVNINILNADNGAAAGMLSVKSEEGLTFLGKAEGVEYGKVFDEMECHVDVDGEGNTIIKCVGNTSVVSEATEKKEMDVYVNLKFKKEQTNDAPEKGVFYKFSVTDEEFCDSKENFIEEDNVWNIKY